MASPTIYEQRQFHTDGQRSNLDRCDWCGELRSAHGQDWGCPTSGKRGRVPVILLILGSLFIVAGLVMIITTPGVTNSHDSINGLGTLFLAGGLVAAVAAATVIRRRGAATTVDE